MSRPRVVFFGTPAFAVPALRETARRCEVVAVFTQPDRPKGRGRSVTRSAVAEVAEELKIPVHKPETLKSAELLAETRGWNADLFAVVAFGAILSKDWLAAPRHGAINLHGSLLPDYRGASPVQRALWDGRTGTGVTTLWMDEGIDTGDVIDQRWVAIEPGDTAETLGARLADVGAPILAESLVRAVSGSAPRTEQPREGSYAKKLTKRDGVVDWSADAVTVWNRQRAVTPWPGATTGWTGRRLLILESRPHDLMTRTAPPGAVLAIERSAVRVACGRGALELLAVKPDGGRPMHADAWARGAHVAPGARLEWNEEVSK